MSEELRACPICGQPPKRNGRLRVGGVVCRGPTHLVQTYGADQAEADANWNTRPALIDHLEADGMVLVPREPTEAMVRAGGVQVTSGAITYPEDIWTAMLSALPVLGVGRDPVEVVAPPQEQLT